MMSFYFQALYLYNCAILKGEPYIIFGMNRHKINQAVPEKRVKIGKQPVLPLQVCEKGLDGLAASYFSLNLPGYHFHSGFGSFEPLGQAVIPFLVFHLVESNMCVFVNALLNHLGHEFHLVL